MKIKIYTPNDHKITSKYMLDELKKYHVEEETAYDSNWNHGYFYQIDVEKASELHNFMNTFASWGKNPQLLTNSDSEWFIYMRY
ncbi:hypothetical protein EFM11_02445 [Lactobacillus helveticus]|nr:hypothetical protein [Lactobacillus helveticus]MCT0164415.1 hypothetical protein [Lactobacillus helveticus]